MQDLRILSFSIFLFVTANSVEFSLAQQNKIDSLLYLLKTDKEDTAKAIHLNNLCSEYINIGEYNTASHYTNSALELERKLNFPKGMSRSYSNLGNIYYRQGNFDKALENHFVALKIMEEMGYNDGVSAAYNNIGIIFFEQGNFDKALENYFLSLKFATDFGGKKGIAAAYNNIGNIYFSQENFDKALENHLTSLKMRNEINDKNGIAASYNNIGNIYYRKKDFDKALENYFASLVIRQEIEDKNGIAASYNNIGEIYTEENNSAEAIVWLKKGLVMSREIGAKDLVKEIYNSLSNAFEKINDYKNALYYKNLFVQIKDSIFNESSGKRIAEMQTKYETEKKEREIAVKQLLVEKRNKQIFAVIVIAILLLLIIGLLIWQNKLRTIQKTTEFQQRFLRLQMNPHFLFNSLGAIQNYLFENRPDDAAVYIAKFADLMRHILESSQSEFVLMERELEILENYLQLQQLRFNKSFDYIITTDPSIDIRFLCIPPMLAQPFIENSIQHGFTKKSSGGHINIRFKKSSEKKITVEIIDNGEGISSSKQKEKKHKSMAMAITKERLYLLNKQKFNKTHFEIIDLEKTETSAQTGTKIIFEVPYKIIDELVS